jgi:ferric-dicitrate binding protein FerR (iron transport regulator)
MSGRRSTTGNEPGRQPPRRRRTVPAALAALLVLAALAAGFLAGYAVRGEPPPANFVTQEREVPVLTVTVEAPPP